MLAEDGHSCRDYDGYLLYSERTILKSIHLSDETNLNAPIKPFEDPEHMKNVIALTFDYRGGGGKGANRIFYSDIHFGNIQQISDGSSDRKTVVESKCPIFSFIVLLLCISHTIWMRLTVILTVRNDNETKYLKKINPILIWKIQT